MNTTGSEKYEVGDVEIFRISETVLNSMSIASLLPDFNLTNESTISENTTNLESVNLSIHTWLLKTKKHTIIIDPGVGNCKERPFTPNFHHLNTPFLKRLRKTGFKPKDVDYVLMTHLHVDHIGWNTTYSDGEWIPTFPNAEYIFSKKEYEFFNDPVNHNDRNKTSVIVQGDSIQPIINAELASMIMVDDYEVVNGLIFKSTPGHSIDHASITLSSKGENALFSGDLFHTPVQIKYPELNSIYDAFEDLALPSRHWGIEYVLDQKATIFSSHFPESSVGQIVKNDSEYGWKYI